MSVPIQTFLAELVTALKTTSVSVQLRRQMVMDKVRSSATKHIIVVPFNDPVTKPESPASYLVTCSATVRLCVVDNTDADAINALTTLWSDVRKATYAKAWSGRRYIPPVADSEFTPDPEQSNFYYMDVVFSAEYQEYLTPVTVPDVAGLTEAAANTAITADGFVPDSDGAFSNTVAKGIVINQSPAAGTAAYAGDIVTITVSFGVEYKVVPVTKDLLPAAAEAALVAAGLVLGTSTSSMTNDTAAGLVSASVPAAGTGVAAGTAVDLTVSLGDRRTEIPVYMTPGVLSTLYVTPITAFDWIHPNGTVQNGLTCTYLRPRGSANTPVYIRCKAGKTIADLTSMQNGTNLTTFVMTDDCAYLKPSSGFLSLSCIRGDVAKLAYLAENTTGGINLSDSAYILYGTLNSWGPTNFSYAVFFYCAKVTGSLQFKSGATTADVWFYGYGFTGSSDAEMAQTIINFDAANAGAFTRTFRCLDIKRSAIEAALPGAAAAITSLLAKGCTFTFKAE